MTRYRSLLLFLGLAAAPAALCGFYPQSYLDGIPQRKADDLYSVRIAYVDGVMPHENPVRVTPGPHWVEIRASGPKSQTFVLKVAPCTHYYLGARKDSLAIDKWKLVVDQEETVGGCDPADELKKFPDPSLRDDSKAKPSK